jgi:hypothetical protein
MLVAGSTNSDKITKLDSEEPEQVKLAVTPSTRVVNLIYDVQKYNRPLWVVVQGLIRPTPYTYIHTYDVQGKNTSVIYKGVDVIATANHDLSGEELKAIEKCIISSFVLPAARSYIIID